MKNYFIILLLFITFCAYGYERTYNKPYSHSYGYMGSYDSYKHTNPYSTTYFTPNVPYSNFYSPLGYSRNILNNRILRGLYRLKRSYDVPRHLSFNFKKGSPTGFSPPISNDILQNLGFNPNDKKQNLNSPSNSMEIFSTPNTNNFYRRHNGQKNQDGGGAVGKTGVTIIYD